MTTRKLAQAPSDCISRVRFAPGAKSTHLLVSSWDAHLRLYDLVSENIVGLHKSSLAVLDCAFLHDASRTVMVGLDRRVVYYDFTAQHEACLGQHDEAIRCVEFDASSGLIFTGSWDRSVRLWDMRRPGVAAKVLDVGTKVFSLDVCANRVVLAGSDRKIHIYDSRRLDAPLEKRESPLKHQLRCVKISTDQRSFASGSVEGRVAIEYFDPGENQQLKYAFKCHREKGADGGEVIHPVNAIAYHPVYGTFATGGSDGGICVWDGYAKKRLWRLSPFDTSVSTVGFSGDGTTMCVGVSYTFDSGEKQTVMPELHMRSLTDAEMQPKAK